MTKIEEDDPRLDGLGPGLMRDMLKKKLEEDSADAPLTPSPDVTLSDDDD